MSAQIRFFDKSKCDFSNTNVTTLASQGDTTSRNVLDRSNNTAWLTTGSVDSDNTTLTIDFVDMFTIDSILLLQHNFKAYTIKYWDGAAYQNFASAISETANTDDNTYYSFTAVATTKIQITITGTMVANADKTLCQVIATAAIGKLNGWPVIKAPVSSRNKKITKMLSGKSNIAANVGGFSVNLTLQVTSDSADLDVIESIFNKSEGVLVWLGGGDESQFSSVRQGYRKEDLYLMLCANEYAPEYYQGIYSCGVNVDMKLIEVTD